ncbi:MAG: type II toxin-antitoxin system VapC family toxin [Pseudomonadota bacterium]
MSYLIDTCALSEIVKPKANRRVIDWFEATPQEALFVSALTLGEIRKGVEGLSDGRRRTHIAAWLEVELPAWFEDRVLPVDAAVADEWGRLLARTRRTVSAVDSLIAATALRHRLTIVTRNVSDFEFEGIDSVNPWEV